MKKRILSLFLALGLCLGLLPAAAMAAESEWALTPIVYDSTNSSQDRLVIFGPDGSISLSGEANIVKDGLMAVRCNGKWGFLDDAGREVIPPRYDDVENFSQGLAAVWIIGQGWGYIDQYGTQIVPCKYSAAKPFSESRAAVCLEEGNGKKWGFVDMTGAEIIPCQYNSVESFSGGYAEVTSGWSSLRVDLFGNESAGGDLRDLPEELRWELTRKYASIDAWSEALFRVKKNDKYGLIDKTGQEAAPCQYDELGSLLGGAAKVRRDGKWGFLNGQGQEVVPCTYDFAEIFNDNLLKVGTGEFYETKIGFLDKAGREVTACKYYKADGTSEGMTRMWTYDACGFMDQTGREVVPCRYKSAQQFSEGLAAVKDESGKWGFVDKTGAEVIPCVYESAESFSEGLALVKGNGKGYHFIDAAGNQVLTLDPQRNYSSVRGFHDGLARVRDNKFRYGFIDRTGREVVELKYYDANDFKDGFASVSMRDPNTGAQRWGLIDQTGREVIPCQYNKITFSGKGFWQVWQGDKFGVFGKNGGAGLTQTTTSTADFSHLDPSLGFQIEGTVLVKYTGPGGDVTVPDGVTEIGPNAFRDCTALTGLVLSDTVVKLDQTALKGCTYLKSLTISNGVELSSGMSELHDCLRLTQLHYPRMSEAYQNNQTKFNSWLNPGSYLQSLRGKEGYEDVAALSDQIVADAGAVTDYDKLKAICVWVAENIDYDYDFEHWSTDPRTVLKDRLAVCQGYAALTQALVRIQGIPCTQVSDHSGEGHVWNQAFADGRWIILDTTWMIHGYDFESRQEVADMERFDMSLPYVTTLGSHKFQSYPSALEKDTPSDWARDETWTAITSYLVPYDLQGNYRENITRQEFCRLAVKLVEQKTGQTAGAYAAGKGLTVTDPFTDTDSPEVLAAYALGIVNGTSATTFSPNGSITRQEAAAMLARTAELLGVTAAAAGETFADAASIDCWAAESVSFISGLSDPTTGSKVMGGVGGGAFDPKGAYTREQAYMTIVRLFHCG